MTVSTELVEIAKIVHDDLFKHFNGHSLQERVLSKSEAVRYANKTLEELGEIATGIRPANILTYLERIGQLSPVRHDYHVAEFDDSAYNDEY